MRKRVVIYMTIGVIGVVARIIGVIGVVARIIGVIGVPIIHFYILTPDIYFLYISFIITLSLDYYRLISID